MIDNIPFFTREAAFGDIVSTTEEEDGMLRFRAVVQRSGNSLIRVMYREGTDPVDLCKALMALGCTVEHAERYGLLSVNVPPETRLSVVQVFLARGAEEEKWGYEEPLLMQ